MTERPAAPPPSLRAVVTERQRAAITARLGDLPEPLLHAVRDARGREFQRLEFLGDAVLELVVRFHARVAGAGCAVCSGDADVLVTDAALADAAERTHLDEWLEWQPSRAREADLVEACACAVWLAHGWVALAQYADQVVHPLAPVAPADVGTGWHGALAPDLHRAHEVLGASVLEVAAAHLAYADASADEFALTKHRNRLYERHRVVKLAAAAGWLDDVPRAARALAEARDRVEQRLADLALAEGLEVAVDAATALLT